MARSWRGGYAFFGIVTSTKGLGWLASVFHRWLHATCKPSRQFAPFERTNSRITLTKQGSAVRTPAGLHLTTEPANFTVAAPAFSGGRAAPQIPGFRCRCVAACPRKFRIRPGPSLIILPIQDLSAHVVVNIISSHHGGIHSAIIALSSE
ncbi:hypothetical protein V8F06_000151 [Rhypophila decipiens]